ncbi:MAG TPA: cytochrome b/b6 domain-containing protein [Terriglobia bacterium]|nr:cytochrome b/b6 domain-containing protein [Terriglobia bacterium]
MMRARYIAISACIAALLCAWPLGAQEPGEPACASCHNVGEKLKNSAHAPVPCATCHVKHEEYPHPSDIPKPACATCHERVARDFGQGVHAQAAKAGNAAAPDCEACHGTAHELVRATSAEFRRAVPDTCGMCHADIATEYKSSVHGQAVAHGVVDAPVCTTCHGEHAILKPQNAASSVSPRNIPGTCAQCHANVRLSRRFGLPPDRVLSFQASYHGMALKSGDETVANCASCHGVHNIFPSSDSRSTINSKNLPATCGKCHLGAGARFALGPIHESPGGEEPKVVGWARSFYLVTIPLVVGLMFLHNFGDWLRKLNLHHSSRRQEALGDPDGNASDDAMPGEFRMFKFERLEHILLVLSFAVLAWTGFALKYPEGWWARPLLAWETNWPVRGTIHRIAAVLFMVVAGMHFISLLVSGKLRQHWKELWPRVSDGREAWMNFAYNVGLRGKRPHLSPHGYVEKAEYWAVVWGAVVMILTGLMLWANRFTLRWLPKSFSDLATAVHFYEAVLAGLAILVWHFYSVIFDPDVYPMETAWLTGRSVKRKCPEDSESLDSNATKPPDQSHPSESVATEPGEIGKPSENELIGEKTSNESSGN